LRIDGNSRTQTSGYRPVAARPEGGSVFLPETEVARGGAGAMGAIAASTGIEALLALQSVDDPIFAKRKAMRRGTALLDTLDDIKADLLAGKVSEGRLNQLLSLIGQAREKTLPGLDTLIDDIELRARVELAKFGRYAAA
jgi:hypothetical protein